MIFDIFFSQGHFSFLSRRFLTHGISGICSLINIPCDNVISIDNYGFGIVPTLESRETNKTNITNRISSEPGAGAEQSFLCPGKLMIKDGGMIQCDHLLLTKKGK